MSNGCRMDERQGKIHTGRGVGDGREKGRAGWWNGLGNNGLEFEHFLFTGKVGGVEAGSGDGAHLDVVAGEAGVLVVGFLFGGELFTGDDAAGEGGEFFGGHGVGLADEDDAAGNGVAVVVEGKVEAAEHAGLLAEGKLEVEGDEVELRGDGLAEGEVEILMVVDDARAPLDGAVSAEAGDAEGGGVGGRDDEVRLDFEGVGGGGEAVALVYAGVRGGFVGGGMPGFGERLFDGDGGGRGGGGEGLQAEKHVGDGSEEPFAGDVVDEGKGFVEGVVGVGVGGTGEEGGEDGGVDGGEDAWGHGESGGDVFHFGALEAEAGDGVVDGLEVFSHGCCVFIVT